MTPLSDAVTVGGATGTLIGAAVGWVIPRYGPRSVVDNVLRLGGLGAVAGTAAGFAVWAAGA